MGLESRALLNTITSSTPLNVNISPPPGPQSYVVVVVGMVSITDTVTMTMASGTFVRAAQITSATRRLEIWVGYNFGTVFPTTLTINHTSGVSLGAIIRVFDTTGNAALAPVFTASAGNISASGSSSDSGSLTPAVGDILIAATCEAQAATSTARVHTGNAYLNNSTSTGVGAMRVEFGYVEASVATPSKEVWTLTAAAEWAAIQVMWTPPAPPTPTPALLLKGLTTQAADAASSF